jgi:membrane-bound lytic murein transglycosylase D
MSKFGFCLTLLLILLSVPAAASLNPGDIGPSFNELFPSDDQQICTQDEDSLSDANDPLHFSWPGEICGPEPVKLIFPDETEICMFWFTDKEEGGHDLAEPMQASLITNYALNPLAVKSVERNITLFTNELKDRFSLWLGRSGRYINMMKKILLEEGMPEDIVFLPLIESGFNTRAYSRSRAAGPWQFIAGTAKRYGLKVNWWVDERRDPVKSTRAAARYLIDLHEMFDSWSLALAAYNAGENKIKRALKRTKSNDFWGLLRTRYIHRETKNYVPKFIAARLIAINPGHYGFRNIQYEDELVYDEVRVNNPLTLDVIAKCAGTTVKAIKELNPELRRWSTPPVKEYALKIPMGSRESFLDKLAAIPLSKRFTVRKYRVRRGDTVSEIAHRMGVSMNAIISYNRLGRRAFIREGQTLTIPVPLGRNRDIAMEHLPTKSLDDGTATRVYTVRWGDTISEISKVTGVPSSTIVAYNKLRDRSFIRAGQKLLIPVGQAND